MKNRFEDLGAALAFAEIGCFGEACEIIRNMDALHASRNLKMMAVTHGGSFSFCFMEYVLSLTERTRLDVVSVHLLPVPRLRIRRTRTLSRARETLLREAEESFGILTTKIAAFGLTCAQVVASDDDPTLVGRVCHAVRGVEFAVVQGDGDAAMRLDLPLPVYRVGC